jgi:hypothetical protein
MNGDSLEYLGLDGRIVLILILKEIIYAKMDCMHLP